MKRNFILTFLACGASVLLCTAAQAQTEVSSTTSTPNAAPSCSGAGHKHGHGGMLEHLTGALGLSGSQQAAIAPILEAAKPQLKTIHDNAKSQRDAVINSTASQITPLLTADQQTKFAQLVQNVENGPAGGGHGKGGRHFAGPGGAGVDAQVQKLTTTLGLTADQQSQIKPILEAAHKQIETIRANTGQTREQNFAQIKDTMQAAHSQINGILTPAQQQQLATMREKWHPNQASSATPTPASN